MVAFSLSLIVLTCGLFQLKFIKRRKRGKVFKSAYSSNALIP